MAVNIGNRNQLIGDEGMPVKLAVITLITTAMLLSLWKPAVGAVVPPAVLWGYGWIGGFTEITMKTLVVITIIHLVFQAAAWWLSGKYREGNLAFTGAGITGFSTGILAAMFFGGLLGIFMWMGFIGRIVTLPLVIGANSITRRFAGGILKVVYGIVMTAVLSYILS